PTSYSPLSLHDALPIFLLAFSNAQRQYPVTATPDATARTYARNCVEYTASVGRCPMPASPSSTCSAWRFPVTMNNDPDAATMRRSEEHTSELQSPDHIV